MSIGSRTVLGLAGALALAFGLLACGDDKPKEPEIVRVGGGSSGGESGSSVELLQVTGRSGTSVLLGGATSAVAGEAAGLSVRHSQSGAARADQAFVVAVLPFVPTGPGPIVGSVSARDQAAILDALKAIGVGKDDVSFDQSLSYGPFASVSVKAAIDGLPTRGKQIIDAIEAVTGRTQQAGVRFALSDCAAALGPVRKAVFEGAAEDAKAFAQAASIALGPLVGATEAPTAQVYGPPSADPCDPSAPGLKTPADIRPLDSEPEVTLNLDITLTYSLSADAAKARLSVAGTGSATAKADEAYVIVAASSPSGPFGPTPLAKRDRDDVIKGIRDLGVDEEDIEIVTPLYGEPTIVSVEVAVGKLADLGKKIVGVVEDILGSSQLQGAYFSHSNCRAVLTEARKQALADAERSAKSLAEAAGVQLGGLVGLSDSALAVSPYPPATAVTSCSEDFARRVALGGPYGPALQPFDAEPEFTIEAAILATYAMTP